MRVSTAADAFSCASSLAASVAQKVSTALKDGRRALSAIADQASDIAEITPTICTRTVRTVGVLDDLYVMGDIALRMVRGRHCRAYVQELVVPPLRRSSPATTMMSAMPCSAVASGAKLLLMPG